MISWHRFYDPATGRYISADPIGLAGGMNLFLYVNANPVNFIDLEGLNPIGDYFSDEAQETRRKESQEHWNRGRESREKWTQDLAADRERRKRKREELRRLMERFGSCFIDCMIKKGGLLAAENMIWGAGGVVLVQSGVGAVSVAAYAAISNTLTIDGIDKAIEECKCLCGLQ